MMTFEEFNELCPPVSFERNGYIYTAPDLFRLPENVLLFTLFLLASDCQEERIRRSFLKGQADLLKDVSLYAYVKIWKKETMPDELQCSTPMLAVQIETDEKYLIFTLCHREAIRKVKEEAVSFQDYIVAIGNEIRGLQERLQGLLEHEVGVEL